MKMRHWGLVAVAAMGVVFGACDPTVTPPGPIEFVAQLTFPDNAGCESAVGSQAISWADCHAFKRHRDSVGTPITANSFVSGAYAPIRAFVNVRYLRYTLSGTPVVCDNRTVQTDLDGNLRVPLKACGANGVRAIVARVYLQYAVQNAAHTRRGFVRSLWEHNRAAELFPLTADDEIQDGYGFNVRQPDGSSKSYAVPMLVFKKELSGTEGVGTVGSPFIVNGGRKVFVPRPSEDSYGYMRQVLSAHHTMVELHEKLRQSFAAEGRETEYFDRVFVSDAAISSLLHYNIWFTETWAYGFRGGISLFRPDLTIFSEDNDRNGSPDESTIWGTARLLSHVDTLAHEFGHSVHAALAGGSFAGDYRFANPMKTRSGTDYDWGHGGSQLQEMGVAFTEGLANAFGQYMINQCNGWVPSARPLTNKEPWAQNMWSGDESCDTDAQNACSAHHVRYHLVARGAASGGVTYTTRMTRVKALTTAAIAGGNLSSVTSNNEFRYGEFACDLLDSDTDVTHAATTNGANYLPNFTYLVNRAFNGYTDTLSSARYRTGLASENVRISIGQLFDAAGGFCPTCSMLPADLTADAYADQRVRAVGGAQSPQTLGRYIVGRGWATDAQMRDVLQSNFMESNY